MEGADCLKDHQLLALAKDIPHRLQVLQPVHRVGLQVAAFGPFVPAVDIKNARAAGPGEQAFLGFLQGGAKFSGVFRPTVFVKG